jgi:hypothetical protein
MVDIINFLTNRLVILKEQNGWRVKDSKSLDLVMRK